MDFGKLKSENEPLSLSLPADCGGNASFLRGLGSKGSKPNFYIGLPKWSQGPWAKSFYLKAQKTPPLKYYASQFNVIELNSTRYWNENRSELVSSWCSQVEKEFKFCPKFYQSISHGRPLNYESKLVKEFCETLEHFGKNLGYSFLQLSEGFSPERFQELSVFMRNFSKRFPLALELRHPGWFKKGDLKEEIKVLLDDIKMPAIITDTPGRRDVLHQRLTCPDVFIRFAAIANTSQDYSRLDNWADRLFEWSMNGIENVYFFIHQPEEKYLIELTSHLIEKINLKLGLNLHVPQSELPIQGELF